MAKKKTKIVEDPELNEAPATEQPITETLEKNYMPYAYKRKNREFGKDLLAYLPIFIYNMPIKQL